MRGTKSISRTTSDNSSKRKSSLSHKKQTKLLRRTLALAIGANIDHVNLNHPLVVVDVEVKGLAPCNVACAETKSGLQFRK